LKSATTVQRKYRNEFGQDRPHTDNIKRWFKKFMQTGSILDRQRLGRLSIDKETIDAMCVAFFCSPSKSNLAAANKLAISRSTFYKVLHKQIWLYAYKLFKLFGLR